MRQSSCTCFAQGKPVILPGIIVKYHMKIILEFVLIHIAVEACRLAGFEAQAAMGPEVVDAVKLAPIGCKVAEARDGKGLITIVCKLNLEVQVVIVAALL